MTIFTIGHSNRTIEAFLAMLKAFNIELLADIRTIPKSRYNPQFAMENLPASLKKAGIEYAHIKELGGLRKAHVDSPNAGWHNSSFRGYADYMQTQTFRDALQQLMALSKTKHVAIMCAESVPWRCHRSLVADALTARGIAVEHIMSDTKSNPHKMTSFAHVEGHEVTYPGPADLFSVAGSNPS